VLGRLRHGGLSTFDRIFKLNYYTLFCDLIL
jgi:hypothetical protein